MKYTVESKEVLAFGMMAPKRVTRYFVMSPEGLMYAQTKTREEAEQAADILNDQSADYQKMVKESGLLEWEFVDQNSAG